MHNKTIPTVILGLVTAGLVGVISNINTPLAAGTNKPLCHWTEGTGYVFLHLSLPGQTAHLQNHPEDFIPESNDCDDQDDTTTTAQQTTTTEGEDTTTTVATTVPEETTTTVTITVDSLPPVEETVPPTTALTQQVLGTLPATR